MKDIIELLEKKFGLLVIGLVLIGLVLVFLFGKFISVANAQSILIKNDHEISNMYKMKDGKIKQSKDSILIPDSRYTEDGYCRVIKKRWVCEKGGK